MPILLVKTNIYVFFVVFILLITPNPSDSISFSPSHYRSLLSLSHSLASRVANLRASRGDFAGASRASAIARKIESLQELGLLKLAWSLGWDYFRNDAWRDFNYASFTDLASAASDLNELLKALNELSRVGSDSERISWVSRNYGRILTVSRSLLAKLLKVFRQSGPLRDFFETVQKEVVDGELLRDCLELGTSDLRGLIQILKDIITPSSRAEL